MLLDAITNKTELEFLKLLGIELINNKLVNVLTGENFVRQKYNPDKWEEYVYKCGNTTVKFIAMKNPYIPVEVWVEKDGLKYNAGDAKTFQNDIKEGRFLYINRIEDETNYRDRGQGIVIEPEVSKCFMNTIVQYRVMRNKLSGIRAYNIKCSLSSITTTSNPGFYGDLDIDTYQVALERTIRGLYTDDKVRDAYLKCMPFIVDEFESLLSFPSRADVLFEKEYYRRLGEVNGKIVDRLEIHSRTRDYEIKRLEEENPNKSAEELLTAKTKIYMDSAYEMDRLIRELLEERDKYIKEAVYFLEEIKEYRNNYYKQKDKVNKK